jgi:hypothetical protein
MPHSNFIILIISCTIGLVIQTSISATWVPRRRWPSQSQRWQRRTQACSCQPGCRGQCCSSRPWGWSGIRRSPCTRLWWWHCCSRRTGRRTGLEWQVVSHDEWFDYNALNVHMYQLYVSISLSWRWQEKVSHGTRVVGLLNCTHIRNYLWCPGKDQRNQNWVINWWIDELYSLINWLFWINMHRCTPQLNVFPN